MCSTKAQRSLTSLTKAAEDTHNQIVFARVCQIVYPYALGGCSVSALAHSMFVCCAHSSGFRHSLSAVAHFQKEGAIDAPVI